MSFLIDPPLLFLSGLFIYMLGERLEWDRHAKIVIGIFIASIFIVLVPFFTPTSSAALFHSSRD